MKPLKRYPFHAGLKIDRQKTDEQKHNLQNMFFVLVQCFNIFVPPRMSPAAVTARVVPVSIFAG